MNGPLSVAEDCAGAQPAGTEGAVVRTLSIVMPIHNGKSTLPAVFAGLDEVADKECIEELLLIDDSSTDGSSFAMSEYAAHCGYRCELIINERNMGLAASYNLGIARARSSLVITMHQDIVLPKGTALGSLSSQFEQSDVAVSYATLLHPEYVWKEYNLWQRAMFSRFVGRKVRTLSGKFDCFDRNALQTLGGFDSAAFRTAGEDGDMKLRLSASGFTALASDIEVIHLHNVDPGFTWLQYLKKEAQIAEAQGVLLRKHGISSPRSFVMVFFRQLLLLGILTPIVDVLVWPIVAAYTYSYTHKAYGGATRAEVCKLALANLAILPTATVFAVRGYVTQRQRL